MMSWILKWILLYPCDGEMCSPVYLALQFVVMQLFCYFYVSTWIKKNITCLQFTGVSTSTRRRPRTTHTYTRRAFNMNWHQHACITYDHSIKTHLSMSVYNFNNTVAFCFRFACFCQKKNKTSLEEARAA